MYRSWITTSPRSSAGRTLVAMWCARSAAYLKSRNSRSGASTTVRILHADKGYDYRKCRQALRRRRIKVRIARKGIESKERLGRHRWVVERTLAWLNRFRRLTVRYERRADIHEAFLHWGCALICLNYLPSEF